MSSARPQGPLWVVVPTYNERENLEPLLSAAREALDRSAPEHSILVVDDNSPDGTGELAQRIASSDSRVSVLRRTGKRGLGLAYVAGFRFALERGAQLVVEMDADFSHDPSHLPALIEATACADLGI
jgi:dolichol-phosphate mannosyltransferase